MSHIATLRCKVENLNALEKACTQMGLQLHMNAHTFKSYSPGKCEHKISVKDNPNAYEIGLARQGKDQHFSLLMDDFLGGEGLIAIVGDNAHKLVQNYGIQVAMEYIPMGFEIQPQQILSDGSVELQAVKF